MDKVVGLIGYPLRHTISPAFQQAAFDYHALPVRYEAWETPPEAVAAAVERVRQPDCLGMNVTIPHKQAVLPLLDEIEPWAAQVGAVNTIVNRGGRLTGHNTDGAGFLRALRETASYEPSGKRAVLLGAGGAARAVAFALAREGAASLTIVNRTADRAAALAADVRRAAPELTVEPLAADERALAELLATADLLVNSTSVGMLHATAGSPVAAEALTSDLFVYDLVYNPAETPLLRLARELGCRTLAGLPMLVYQGAAAFEIWTGKRAPVGLMLKRAADALGQ